ncbi:MAG: nicotinate-nucleotide diphosphorylase (carboxylating) [Omnitrophica WOR_2 bacterium RIFCSPHIGHO2_01_FULL_48_9]|nr:MAG: nicotinate-nucleotide diphosphorylase (carboxylating) [Omnitrophica WOR_2 bacterium RIFCSPHIGHO2_01_FULL_48_9]
MRYNIANAIRQALKEDKASQDITTNFLVIPQADAEAHIVVKEDCVLCGLEITKKVFQIFDKNIVFRTAYKDGQRVRARTKIIFLKGKTRALLKAERVALNFLQHLSGVATLTQKFVQMIRPLKTQILDTRKTTPGLRFLQKYAVRCGGGVSHRHDLNEMILVKDNHLALLSSKKPITKIVSDLRKKTKKPIEIEVTDLPQLREAVLAKPDIILLDNMSTQQMRKAVAHIKKLGLRKRIRLEASGGVNLKNIRSIARTGIDRISIGALTHSAKAVDISMEIKNATGK